MATVPPGRNPVIAAAFAGLRAAERAEKKAKHSESVCDLVQVGKSSKKPAPAKKTAAKKAPARKKGRKK